LLSTPSPFRSGFILDNRFFREYGSVKRRREGRGATNCRPGRSQAGRGLPALPTMSAIWDNPENICSLRVLLPVTPSGPWGGRLQTDGRGYRQPRRLRRASDPRFVRLRDPADYVNEVFYGPPPGLNRLTPKERTGSRNLWHPDQAEALGAR
jgi:hypothetical protein